MFMPKRTLLASAISTCFIVAPSFANDHLDDVRNSDFETIVISGSKTEKPLKDVAGSISVVSQDELEKQVTNDMSQLFKYDPSVQVTGNAGEAQNFIVRGMGGDRVLMIKDGMRANEGYGADGLNDIVGRGFIEVDVLKQVEVAKGAASSLYGSDALGGIVVFTTKDPADYLKGDDKFAGNVRLGYSQQGEQVNAGGSFAFKTGGVEHLINLTSREASESQNYNETRPALDISSNSYFYKANYNLDPKQTIKLSVDHWAQDVAGDIAYGLLGSFRTLAGYEILTENSTSDKQNTSLQLAYASKEHTAIYDNLHVSVYKNDTEQTDVEYGQLDINANFGFPLIEIRDMSKTAVYKQDTQGFLSNASLKLNEIHTLGYGLDIEKSTSQRTEVKLYSVEGVPKDGYPQISDKFPATDVSRSGFFINDEITLANGLLTVTPGARFDTYKMDPNGAEKADGSAYKKFDENHLSLNLGALYKLNKTIALFAQYGQGFKVPAYDLAYIDHDNSLFGYRVVPSDDLSPEESDSYEIGLRGHSGNWFFNGAIFYTDYVDFLGTELVDIETTVSPFTGEEAQVEIFQYKNIDAVTIKGVEASMRYYVDSASNLSLFANASYQDGKNDMTGEYINSISPLSGVAGITYDQDKLFAELLVNWAQRMDKVATGNVEVAGHVTLDLLVAYEFSDDLKLNLSANNLTDKEYVHYLSGAGHRDASTLNNVTEAGRNISAKITYSF